LIERYYFSYESGILRYDGQTIRVTTKEAELRSLSSCGGCNDPRGVWTIRITPAGVQNLGHRFLRPEFKWTDDLLSAIEQGQDASELASPAVLAVLRATLSRLNPADNLTSGKESTEPEKARFHLGMLAKLTVLQRSPHGGKFILASDEATLCLTYTLRSGKPFFTNLRSQQN